MIPTTVTSICILIAFVLPGYWSSHVRSLVRTGRKIDQFERFLEFLSFGSLNVIFLSMALAIAYCFGVIDLAPINQSYQDVLRFSGPTSSSIQATLHWEMYAVHPFLWFLFQVILHNTLVLLLLGLFSIIIVIGIGYISGRWTGKVTFFGKTLFTVPINPYPTAWDQLFLQTEELILHLFLKDGTQIAGLYADKSFASLESEPDIYLQSEITIKRGRPQGMVENSQGIYIRREEISLVKIYPLSMICGEE